jgi:hypothetical protein
MIWLPHCDVILLLLLSLLLLLLFYLEYSIASFLLIFVRRFLSIVCYSILLLLSYCLYNFYDFIGVLRLMIDAKRQYFFVRVQTVICTVPTSNAPSLHRVEKRPMPSEIRFVITKS